MNTLELEEKRPLIFIEGIPNKVRDSRWAYQKQLAVYFILVSTLFERMAFYSLAANIVLFLNSHDFTWDPSDSATAWYIFSGEYQLDRKSKFISTIVIIIGLSYIFTIIFAAISDAKLGRAKTIGIGK